VFRGGARQRLRPGREPGALEQGEVVVPLLLGDRDPVGQRLQILQDGRRRLGVRLFDGRSFSAGGCRPRGEQVELLRL
jgi:hypothetical protein